MSAKPSLCSFRIWIVAAFKDTTLNVTESRFHWVIVWTPFRQTDPVQLQFAHRAACLAAFARVGAILIQGDPDFQIWIPMSHAAHKLADILRAFPGQKSPMNAPAAQVITQEEVEETACLLSPLKNQTLGRAIKTATVGLHGDGFDVKE